MPPLARQPRRRVPRTERRGMSPVAFGLIFLAILVVITFFGFTKSIPFTHDFRLNAVFRTANNVKPGSPVRIAGVNVGKVTKVTRYRDSEAALVQMEIEDTGLPIHEDATAKIRPRIFLEGNFFVDLRPGTPSAPTLEDDDEPLPMTNTSAPVQLDQVLTALQKDPRDDLQGTLVGLGDALTREPTARDDADQDPDVRGESASVAFNHTYTWSADALRNAALVNQAVLGSEPHDVSRLIAALQRVSFALGRSERRLQDLVTNFNTTMAAFADEQDGVRATIAALPETLTRADAAFDSLNAAFPPTRAFAREVLPGVRETPATIEASFPWIRETRGLLSEDELRGLANELRPTVADLAGLIDETTTLLPQVDLVNRCVIRNVVPTLRKPVPDGQFTTGRPNYQEFAKALVALAGEGQNFDGNGMYVRFQPGGGAQTVSTGRTNLGSPPMFGTALRTPLGTRPAYPGRRPPYRPDQPCFRQTPPDLAAETGPPNAVVSP